MPEHDPLPDPPADASASGRRRRWRDSRQTDGFGTVRRGYDPRQVDEHLRRIGAQTMILVTDRDAALLQTAQLGRELDAARAELERLSAQLPRISAPDNIETFTERLQVIGRLAREEVIGLQADTVAAVAAMIDAARPEPHLAVNGLAVNGLAVSGLGATTRTTAGTDTGAPSGAGGAVGAGEGSACGGDERPSAGTRGPADGVRGAPDPGVRTGSDVDLVGCGDGSEAGVAVESGDGPHAEQWRRLRRDAAMERARLHEAALDVAAQQQERLRIALALHCRETLTQLAGLHADATRTAQQVLAQATAAAQDILAHAHGQVEQLHAVRAQLTTQLRGCATLLEPATDHIPPTPSGAPAPATAPATDTAGPTARTATGRAVSPGQPPMSPQPLLHGLSVTADSDPVQTPPSTGAALTVERDGPGLSSDPLPQHGQSS
jgi:DivIVA domain-containing protein